MAREEKDREAKEVKVEDGEPGPGAGDEGGGDSRVDPKGWKERGSYLGHRLGRSKIRVARRRRPMLGLQTDFRPPRASIQTPVAFLPERSPGEKEAKYIERTSRALASGFGLG